MAGIAAEEPPKIALNWAMIKVAPEPEKVAQGKPATANTNPALAILAINTPVPAPAIPAAPALLAAVSILNAIVLHLILGHPVLVNALQLINTPVAAPAIPAARVLPAAESILNAIA